ncbi:MAG: VWA domain-containing protein [Lachnospiraceae bacterium]|nr:VWA domain-containing protein [Lachnospiraceae bacterium]
MIFESLWPLFFLAAVPIIIILYLLKPKGIDYLISSNLLWQKFLKNEQSRTFFEKFVHNLLMYIQILIIGLLVIALMSPFIRAEGRDGGRKILLVDTSGSMQHVDASGKSRLEQAVEQACDYVRASEDAQFAGSSQTSGNAKFSLVTVDGTGVNLLAVDITDADSLVRTLKELECSDSSGKLTAAQNILDTLSGEDTESAARLIVYTDGAGAEDFDSLVSSAGKELHVVGEPTTNVANEYTVFSLREDGFYDVMVSMTNYSDKEASFDVGLYDEGDELIALSQMHLASGETKDCLFEQIDWIGQNIESRLGGISFAGGGSDSLAKDNVSQAVKNRSNLIDGLLVGDGNTFIEKAYQAVTGNSIARAKSDTSTENNSYNVVIYDMNNAPQTEEGNKLLFGDARGESVEKLENVVLDMTDCDLTAGMTGFNIGVNTAYCFALPEGTESFLEYDGKCVGYYGERDGRKEVVVGFDIRESDFPLRAEFPVFLANAMIYLSDTSLLATNVYYAGEELVLQPWAEFDMTGVDSSLRKAGLYQVGSGDYQESYVVRFRTDTESDGQVEAASVSDSGELRLQKVKRTLRNIFLLIALAFLAAEWIIYVRQMRYRGKFYLILRCIVFVCVLMALLGVSVKIGSSGIATVFVVDLSDSNEEHLEEMENYLSRTVSDMPSRNVYGIVTFGKDALVEQFLTSEKHYAGIMTVPEMSATNFEDAVSRSLTLIPADYNARLVVLTDGKETGGDIRHMAQALSASRAEFLTLLYEDEETDDAYIENVSLPANLHPGDKYSITVLVESNYETDAVIELYNGSRKAAASEVHLNRGSNRFVFSQQVDDDESSNNMEILRVQVNAVGDTCNENDVYNAYSIVEATPRVLVISGRNTNVSGFTSALNAAGCDYSVVSALNAPDNIDGMLEYKSIILVDTYIDDLPAGFLDNLETYVKDYGCGFVCCGGEDSFALGGYRDTVLETVLPVDMELRGVDEKPSMAMVMVIDRSGSMSGSAPGSDVSNLDVAIKAAVVAVDNLRESDYVGVLTFDDMYKWQVELTQADDKAEIKDEIRGIDEGGGTTIKPALNEAFSVISQSEASIKHVVLLTDGMGETTDFRDVVKSYTDSGITLSTVAVGDGSDTQLLESLANDCGGRYYYSDISSDIPKIFAQEVFLGGDSYIQNGNFALSVRTGHELTANLFDEGWPVLYGYISSTPKTASSTIISSVEKDDPILTVWQYGLGRTVAWNSDVTGEWSGAFAGEDDYVQLWKRIVDYSTGNVNMGEDRVNVVTAGEETQMVYQTENYSGDTEILATIIDPEGNSEEVKLHATAPGTYEMSLPTSDAGLYHFNVRRMENGEIQNYMTTAAAVQFSYEYKFDVSTAGYLSFAQQYGRLISPDENIWTNITTGAGEKRSITNWLLGLAICLFLADVAMRRFQYVPDLRWTKKVFEKVRPVENGRVQDGQKFVSLVQDSQESIDAPDVSMQIPEKGLKSVKEKSSKKEKKSKPSEQTLDTSQLLKKKDDRNI